MKRKVKAKVKKKRSKKTTIDTPVKDLRKKETLEHYNAIQIESIQSDLRGVIEGTDAKIDRLARKVDSGFNELRERISAAFDLIELSNRSLSRRIDGLEYKMETMHNILREDLDTKFLLLSKKMDKVIDRVDNHEERITKLEAVSA